MIIFGVEITIEILSRIKLYNLPRRFLFHKRTYFTETIQNTLPFFKITAGGEKFFSRRKKVKMFL